MREVGLFFLLIFLWTAAQVLMKLGMKDLSGSKVNIKFFYQALTSRPVIAGLFISALAVVLWLVVLSRFELSYSNLIASLTFVCVVIASSVFLGEEISLLRWIGAFFIAFGVFLVAYTR